MKIRKLVILAVTLFMSLSLKAQGDGMASFRRGCMSEDFINARRMSVTRSMLQPLQSWDPARTYRQLVVLVDFADEVFSCDNPRERYDRIFNEPGYNEGVGPGCVADYFREQSNGLFNVRFDVTGPFRVECKARPSESMNTGVLPFRQAVELLVAANPEMDFRPYDWNGDGMIEQVVFVCASFCANGGGPEGYLWPNTGLGLGCNTPDGLKIDDYSASAELWAGRLSCGIGTICHEYCHCLGLPDIYPVDISSYSVCDEWDLMDGGNYTNWGWCPPNLTAQEKMYLGWLEPVELDAPAVLSGMKSISEGGPSYLVRHTDTEYLILENRQRKGWDAAIPGKGLIILHVDFNERIWRSNNVNNVVHNEAGHFRYDIIHADNLDFVEWSKKQLPDPVFHYVNIYTKLYNRCLSTSAYPWSTDSVDFVNACLTDSSVPAAVMYNENAQGSRLLGKPITNIRMSDDGSISFDFMQSSATVNGTRQTDRYPVAWYDIGGRLLSPEIHQGHYPEKQPMYIIRYSDGSVEKRLPERYSE